MATSTIQAAAATYAKSGTARQIKFPDGTMIVTDESRITTNTSGGKPYAYYGSATITNDFLPDFIDNNFAITTCVASSYPEQNNSEVQAIANTGFTLRFASNQNNYSATVRWMAIGRWK